MSYRVIPANNFASAPEVDQDSPQTPQAGSKTGGCESPQHTPGPWFPYRNGTGAWDIKIDPSIFAQSLAYVGSICPEYFPGDPESNARLLSAAPELLEALRGVIRIADRNTVEFDLARAAIAKATGKDGAK